VSAGGRIGSDRVNAGGKVSADLGIRLEEHAGVNVTRSGAEARAEIGGYVGTAHGEAHATVGGVTATGKVDAGIGVGASIHAKANIDAQGFHLSGKAGLFLLVGAKGSFDVDIKTPEVLSDVARGVHNASNLIRRWF
jgi:hypothetical protein